MTSQHLKSSRNLPPSSLHTRHHINMLNILEKDGHDTDLEKSIWLFNQSDPTTLGKYIIYIVLNQCQISVAVTKSFKMNAYPLEKDIKCHRAGVHLCGINNKNVPFHHEHGRAAIQQRVSVRIYGEFRTCFLSLSAREAVLSAARSPA